MPGSILGTRVTRVEDPDLITGRGRYVGDIQLDGLASLAFVRSPIAHGRLDGIDATAALAVPGVIAVLTAGDLGVPAFHGFMVLNERCARPPLAVGKVRFAGEPVAIVVAETAAAAADGAELVAVDLTPLPAVADPERALAAGASLQFEELGTNLAAGERDEDGEEALREAAVVVRARMVNQRVAVAPMEGNAITVVPGDDGRGHDLTVYVSTQMPHGLAQRASEVLDLPVERIHVVTPDVGGGFGGKAGLNAEHAAVIAAARRLGRPVSWVETRTENLM